MEPQQLISKGILERLWEEDREKVIHNLYKIRDRLSTKVSRDLITSEVIEDIFLESVKILITKYPDSSYLNSKKLLFGISKLEFKITLRKKLREFYWLLGREQWEGYLFNERANQRIRNKRFYNNHKKKQQKRAKKYYWDNKIIINEKQRQYRDRKRLK